MKKRLTTTDIIPGFITGKVVTRGWALCIGAGTSLPIFPDWNNLVVSLIKKDKSLIDINAVKEITTAFSPDSLIQAASKILDKDEKESTQHFWITKKPKFKDSMRWTEAAVSHLGVRIIWINDWKETEAVLRNLIGIKKLLKNNCSQ